MSEYENWFSVRFPNIQATIDQSNDQESKLLKLACKEVWQHQQAEIDQLNSVLDERTKEWLQAIELGTYFENVAKPLKEENDSLRVQLSLQRYRNKALEAELTSSRNYGDGLHGQLNNMETCYIEKKKQVEACAALVSGWREKPMGGWSDYARGGLHSRQDCADDLEKALRGEHE